jgi:hypothetical protein
MSPVEQLVEALTNAGLTFGRPATIGHPEVRVRSGSGREYAVTVLRYSFMVAASSRVGAHDVVQKLTVADVVETVRNDAFG